MLIVFEGIDGTGKSTQVRLLTEALREAGHQVTASFEPTTGVHGKKLRSSAQRPEGRYPPEEELALFLEDRKDHLENLIKPALDRGEIVVLDRYYFSTMAYQGSLGLDPKMIRRKNEAFARQPDLAIVLTQPIEVSLERIGLRGGGGDAFEKQECLEACAAIFASLDDPYVHFIGADRPVEIVHEEVRRLVFGLMM